MASKQLGKLRQWAGEKISLEKKIVATEEFKDLEQDVELRRQGVERLYVASEAYWKYLAKKKETESEQPVSTIESLATVMVAHGEEFGDQSAYGQALTKFGQAHFKLATLQEQYSETFRETYLASLERYQQEVKEYHAIRRKLKSRRLAYDAAITQSQKQLKKDKEREIADEEVRTAQARFEEVSEEAQLRMTAIQDREIDQFKDLSQFLEMETKFIQSYLEILKDLKRNWIDESEVVRVPTNRISGPTHIARATTPGSRHHSNPNSDMSEGENEGSKQKSKRSNSNPPLAPPRQRSSGWATSFLKKDKMEKSSNFEALEDEGSDDDPERHISAPTTSPTSRSNLPVGSTSLRSPPPPTGARSGSKSGFSEPGSTSNSPLQPLRTLKSTERLKSTKIRRALYDFTAANTDELIIAPGDEIQVISEPSESWWLGECRGRRGLFPVSYTEDVPQKPPLPARPPSLSSTNKLSAPRSRNNSLSGSIAPSDRGALGLRRSNSTKSRDRRESLKLGEQDEPFGDHYSTSPSHQLSPAFASPESSDQEDDERGFLVGQTGSSPPALGVDTTSASTSGSGAIRKLTRSFSKKGPPPPPPMRRSNTTSSLTPGKNTTQTVQTVDQGASPFLTPTTPTGKWHKKNPSGGTVLAKSPFDSHKDLDGEGNASPGTSSHGRKSQGTASGLNMGSESDDGAKKQGECFTCDCDEFQQNPFKPDGYCKACFHHH